jgi:hypothetical protein
MAEVRVHEIDVECPRATAARAQGRSGTDASLPQGNADTIGSGERTAEAEPQADRRGREVKQS